MYIRSSALLLRWLKVPPEPHPPFGDPASLRVFRAGKNFFSLKLAGWGVGQLAVLIGIIFWVVVFVQVEEGVHVERAKRARQPPAPAATVSQQIRATAEAAAKSVGEARPPAGPTQPQRLRLGGELARVSGDWHSFIFLFTQLALSLPPWAFPVLWVLKLTGIGAYLVQIPFTYAIMRLDYEMRWYVVTDRSLRIRTGVWSVQETTMSFANLQQVEVSQGPLQRLLKLADVKVQSAGGSDNPHGKPQDDLHTGHFHGVDNAHEIRDLIQARLRRFRESGLGDPEETRRAAAVQAAPVATPAAGESADADVLAAARELAAEAKALRLALG